jgi:hypothetical protein
VIFVGDASHEPLRDRPSRAAASSTGTRRPAHLDAAQPKERWSYLQSIEMIRTQMEGRMFPLTLAGLDEAMKELVR